MNSTKKMARTAGFLYLIIVITGIFNLMYVPGKLFVHGNSSITINNILASQLLYRTDMFISLVSSIVFLFLAIALYRLFKEVSQEISAIMVILVIIQTPFAFLEVLNQMVTLELARGAPFFSVFDASQREALAFLFLQINSLSVTASYLFWGLWLFPLATLVSRSGYIPKFLGVWLILNGLTYLVLCLTGFFLPQYLDTVNKFSFPFLFGEVAFTFWLLIKGVKVSQVT